MKIAFPGITQSLNAILQKLRSRVSYSAENDLVSLTKRVALIRGDGTGPELVESMLAVLKAAGTKAEFVQCDAGLEWWEKHGGPSLIPDETWKILEASTACFKGPTTTPWTPGSPRSVAVSIRQKYSLYANVRPIKTYKGHVSVLGEVDFVCVREATEGMYSGLEHRLSEDTAIGIRKITREASRRIAEYAFLEAERRKWSTVYAISKANILKETDGLFLEAVRAVAQNYPGVKLEEAFIDNFSQQLNQESTTLQSVRPFEHQPLHGHSVGRSFPV